MAAINVFVHVGKTDIANIRFRLRDGIFIQLYYVSEIEINPNHWDNKKECIKSKSPIDMKTRRDIEMRVAERKNLLYDVYERMRKEGLRLNSTTFNAEVFKLVHKDEPVITQICIKESAFYTYFQKYIDTQKVSYGRIQNYKNALNHLRKFEEEANLNLSIQSFSLMDIQLLDKYLTKNMGVNTGIKLHKIVRTFFNWCIKMDLLTVNPYIKFKLSSERYGTPYFLTIAERNQIYNHIFEDKYLEQIRDLFVFQCMIGCRVDDFFKLTRNNLINGAIEYVQGKTKEYDPKTIRVPLNSIALEIIDKYENMGTNTLVPLPNNHQYYNAAIKEVVKQAGIKRKVTIINTMDSTTIQKPIYEIASSHMARRTFIGNLYDKVADPKIISSMSGHSENSRAFSRYRVINEDIKKDLVSMLE